jgi:hypothetical protein
LAGVVGGVCAKVSGNMVATARAMASKLFFMLFDSPCGTFARFHFYHPTQTEEAL